jgi:hypothetical protein
LNVGGVGTTTVIAILPTGVQTGIIKRDLNTRNEKPKRKPTKSVVNGKLRNAVRKKLEPNVGGRSIGRWKGYAKKSNKRIFQRRR